MRYLSTYQASADFLYQLAPVAFYSNFEIMLGIVAACIATMRPLLRYFPCLGVDMASFGGRGRPYNDSYKMCDLMPTGKDQAEEQGEMDRSSSCQALMLPQYPPGAKVKYEKEENICVCRRDSIGGAK